MVDSIEVSEAGSRISKLKLFQTRSTLSHGSCSILGSNALFMRVNLQFMKSFLIIGFKNCFMILVVIG